MPACVSDQKQGVFYLLQCTFPSGGCLGLEPSDTVVYHCGERGGGGGGGVCALML